MRKLSPLCRRLFAAAAVVFATVAQAQADDTTLNFAITRNGDQIGTTTVRLQRDGGQLVAEITTRIKVEFASITFYRMEQRETERWADGKLVGLQSVTDDNGTIHHVSATRSGDKLSVNADGKVTEFDPAIMPASLWNVQLVKETMAFNSKDGSVMQVSVVDHGKEQLLLKGRRMTAHHYSIKTNFPQDVWYDEASRLLQVELRGSDGSKILYQPS